MTNFVLRPDNNRDMVLGRLQGFISALSKDKPWLISVEIWKAPRSVNQNRYLWGVCYPEFLKALPGVEDTELHEELLKAFTGVVTKVILGKEVEVAKKRSHEMKKPEFCAFVDFIQKKAAEEYGVFIPDADPMRNYK